MAKLVYIGGFGRSGSTLLEYLLTCQPDLVACGEIVRHVRRRRTRKACTCGQPAAQCPIWGPFQLARHAEPLDHETLTLAILAQVSQKFHTMVELSKTAWGSALMPFRFRSRLDQDFLLVHIVRDPRAVCWSTIKSVMSGKQNKRLHFAACQVPKNDRWLDGCQSGMRDLRFDLSRELCARSL